MKPSMKWNGENESSMWKKLLANLWRNTAESNENIGVSMKMKKMTGKAKAKIGWCESGENQCESYQ
jgi:hypothetical protein